jgi:hypothetical protein
MNRVVGSLGTATWASSGSAWLLCPEASKPPGSGEPCKKVPCHYWGCGTSVYEAVVKIEEQGQQRASRLRRGAKWLVGSVVAGLAVLVFIHSGDQEQLPAFLTRIPRGCRASDLPSIVGASIWEGRQERYQRQTETYDVQLTSTDLGALLKPQQEIHLLLSKDRRVFGAYAKVHYRLDEDSHAIHLVSGTAEPG